MGLFSTKKTTSATTNNLTDARVSAGMLGLSQSNGNTFNVNDPETALALLDASSDGSRAMLDRSSDVSRAMLGRSSDAIKAMANMGTDVVRRSGESVVDLTRAGMDSNFRAWDSTVSAGAALVDKLIDASTEQIKAGHRATEQIAEKGFGISQAAISNFQPTENKAQDTSLKLGMIAAAGVAATLLLAKMK